MLTTGCNGCSALDAGVRAEEPKVNAEVAAGLREAGVVPVLPKESTALLVVVVNDGAAVPLNSDIDVVPVADVVTDAVFVPNNPAN